MPGCVLRASGDEFQPHEFLAGSIFSPCNVFRKGERRGKKSVWTTSGFTLEVSGASGDEFSQQIQDAVEFLAAHRDEIIRLKACAGLSDLELDFGVNRKKVFVQCNYLPPQLLTLAGTLGIGVEISIYGADDML